jgi:hypothetical protein
MSKDNLELWMKVEKTDPKHTKKANVRGNKITAIAPQYQIMNATREFGRYGCTWGFKSIKRDYSLLEVYKLVVVDAVFYYPGGEFPITSSIKMYMNKDETMVDSDFAKKIETDTLTKALSKLGFNADVFMGRYDDVKYMNDITKEFAPKPEKQPLTNEGLAYLRKSGTLEQLKQASNERELTDVQNEVINDLIKKHGDK